MTVESSSDRAQYATNGTTGPWTVPFYFLEDEHLQVVYADAAGTETTLSLGAGFTVAGAGVPSGGTVTTTAAYGAGGTITILRDIEALQETDYVETDSFPAASHERAIDKLTMLVQQLKERLGRALTFPRSSGAVDPLPSGAAAAGRMLTFTDTGDGIVATAFTATQVAAAIVASYPGNGNVLTLKGVGAAGDGIADDTAKLLEFVQAGGGRITSGIYMIDDVVLSNRHRVVLEEGAVLRKRSGAAANSTLVTIGPGAEFSDWTCEGAIDGNRPGLAGAWATANPTLPGYFAGWLGIKTTCAHVRIRGLRLTNWIAKPAWFAGDYNIIEDIVLEDCGDAPIFGWEWFGAGALSSRPTGNGARGQMVRGIKAIRTDNAGLGNVFQHAIDLQGCLGGSYAELVVDQQGGDLAGGSTFASGITAEDCEDCRFLNWSYRDPTTDVLKHLAFSMLGCRGCVMVAPTAKNLAGLALELNGCQDCDIVAPNLDGQYRATTAVPLGDSQSLGLSVYDGVWNSARNSKSQIGTRNCKLLGGIVQRFAYGTNLRGASQMLKGVQVVGNLVDGAVTEEKLFTDHFAGDNLAFGFTDLIDCIFERNGSRGINGASFRHLRILNCSVKNNGQNSALSDDARAGVAATAGGRLTVAGACDISDDQAWTDVKTCSFEPQSSVGGRVVVYIRELGRIGVGQTLRLVGAKGGGVDYVGRVIDIGSDDAVTLQTTTAQTLSATGNTTALTGTWTGSGTVLTGTGTLATTEIRGQVYVTVGGVYRRVTKALTDGQITINAAFPAPLAGASLSVLAVDVAGIPSQTQGVRAFGAVSQIMLDPANVYEGNLVHRTNLSIPANCLPGAAYYRRTLSTTSSGTVNLQTAIPAGHRLLGVATNNDVAITGGVTTSYDLRLVNAGGSTLETIAATVALAKNTKVTGSLLGSAMLASGNILRAIMNPSAPTAGAIACEGFYRVDGAQALPDAP